MKSHAVTLAEMLDARENRAALQRELLKKYGEPLVCFTMNIPGEYKDTPLVRLAFLMGALRLSAQCVTLEEVRFLPTGPEGYFSSSESAERVKKICESIEESRDYARLFDMDVLLADGTKLSRETPRRCILCDCPAAECARSRRHGLDALKEATEALLLRSAAENISSLAERALTEEVHTTPKPGLVDENNTGAHDDMDVPLFERSARAIAGYFGRCFVLGYREAERSPAERMALLRKEGLAAERDMLAATNGVNTHKGLIYSLGLLCGGLGTMFRVGGAYTEIAAACARSDISEALAAAKASPQTHGDALYAESGVRGVRGEAAEGFPHAREAAARLHELAREDIQHAAAWLLPEIMAELEDTNALHRGGAEGAAWLRAESKRICALSLSERTEALERLDEECIRRHISPGGAADTLALAIFMCSLDSWLKDITEDFHHD